MIGTIHAAGLTVEQLEMEIGDRLKKYFKAPEVWITRMEMRSQPVAVIGAVTNPGVHQLQGRKTLVEILSMAGGLKEDAGYTVKITRLLELGRIPLPNASEDPTGQFSIAEVPLRDLTQAANPAGNILIMPHDVITVPKADMVYVIGDVGKSGGIILGGQHQVTVLQAVSMAAGLAKTAKAKEARILRLNPSSSMRDEVRVDLKALLAGKIADVPMQPEDILFVPNSSSRNVTMRALEAALQIGTGVAILSARP
jgi:polysaccharide export outer membrane protein